MTARATPYPPPPLSLPLPVLTDPPPSPSRETTTTLQAHRTTRTRLVRTILRFPNFDIAVHPSCCKHGTRSWRHHHWSKQRAHQHHQHHQHHQQQQHQPLESCFGRTLTSRVGGRGRADSHDTPAEVLVAGIIDIYLYVRLNSI